MKADWHGIRVEVEPLDPEGGREVWKVQVHGEGQPGSTRAGLVTMTDPHVGAGWDATLNGVVWGRALTFGQAVGEIVDRVLIARLNERAEQAR